MIYILVHKTVEKEISRHFTVNKDAQNFMWNEYDEVCKTLLIRYLAIVVVIGVRLYIPISQRKLGIYILLIFQRQRESV